MSTMGILRSLVWEYGRQLIVPWLGGMTACLVLPWIVVRAIFGVPAEAFDSTQFYVTYFCLGISLSCGWSYSAQVGVRQRLFVLPLSTLFITTWLLIAPVITAVAGHCIATGTIYLLYGAEWPWLRPLLYFALIALVGKAVQWRMLVGSVRQLPLLVLIVVGILFCMATRFLPGGIQGGIAFDVPFSVVELTLLSATGLGASMIGYQAVCNSRINISVDGITTVGLAEQLEVIVRRAKGWQARSWTSPSIALRSLYWRQGAIHGMLGGGVLAVLTGIMLAVAFSNGERVIRLATVLMLVMPISHGMLLGISVGLGIRRPGDLQRQAISPFVATKPVSTHALWKELSRLLLVSSTISWGMLFLACAGVVGIAFTLFPDRVAREYASWQPVVKYGVFGVLAWVSASFGAMLATARLAAAIQFFGRDDITKVATVVVGAITLAVLFAIPLLPSSSRPLATSIGLLVAGSVVLVVTIASFLIAFSRSMIGVRQLLLSFVIWLALGLLCLLLPDWDLYRRLAAVGLSASVVISVGMAPLALHANRHR